MKKYFACIFMLACLILCGAAMMPNQAGAAMKKVKLKNRTSYTQYDVTGDGKADKIEVRAAKSNESFSDLGRNWNIKVNSKQIFFSKKADYLEVTLYFENNKIYWLIKEGLADNDDICGCALYEYKKGRLIRTCDFYSNIQKNIYDFHFGVDSEDISSNKAVVSCGNEFGGTGWLHWKMVYRYKNGAWKLQGKTYAVTAAMAKKDRIMTAKRTIQMFKKPGGNSTAFTVKSGDKVKITKLCINGKKTYVQAKNSKGQSGWFQSPAKAIEYFKETMYAG